MKLVSKSVLALVTAGVLSLPMAASAAIKANHVDANNVVVSFTVEDLQTVQGRAALKREVRAAARQVCGTGQFSKDRSLRHLVKARACYNEAVTDALSELSSGELQVSAR
ncbi:MAG: UrcA family protein [Pseudomonadales bacterium]|jgi:UrcA family protein